MKKSFLKTGSVALFVALGLITFTSRNALSDQAGGRLEGTWDVLLTPRDCTTGARHFEIPFAN